VKRKRKNRTRTESAFLVFFCLNFWTLAPAPGQRGAPTTRHDAINCPRHMDGDHFVFEFIQLLTVFCPTQARLCDTISILANPSQHVQQLPAFYLLCTHLDHRTPFDDRYPRFPRFPRAPRTTSLLSNRFQASQTTCERCHLITVPGEYASY
jgi:hypothetical protein